MTLTTVIQEAKKWTAKEQSEFCRFISQNITIRIRDILSYKDTPADKKLGAIKWLNEFHHRINNIKFEIEYSLGTSCRIELLGKHATHYAKQNKLTAGHMSEILIDSYHSVKDNQNPN